VDFGKKRGSTKVTKEAKTRWRDGFNLAIKSDVGIMFLLLNLVGLAWYALVHNRPLPDGLGVIVVGIFGAKTVHSTFGKGE
jgi:hypothetical protein